MEATVAMIMEEVLISIIMITATTEEVAIMEDHATEVVEEEVVEAEEVVEVCYVYILLTPFPQIIIYSSKYSKLRELSFQSQTFIQWLEFSNG